MSTVKQVLSGKENNIWHVSPQETVFEAIQLMADRRVGALLVLNVGRLTGIISERDYAREVILKGRASKETRVEQIMSTQVVTASPLHRIQDALELMTNHRIRHLPILENEQVVGIVSIGDLVKELINEQQQTIEQLESYIKG